MRKMVFICCLILIFGLSACSSNNEPNEPANGNANSDNGSQVAETEHEDHGYEPNKAVPENLPIYPDAILTYDVASYGDNSWQWLYNTTASGNEIVEFFKTEFQNLGFEIDGDGTFAYREEFFIATTDSVISVYWLSIDDLPDEDVNPDTSGRGYSIVVNLDQWNDR